MVARIEVVYVEPAMPIILGQTGGESAPVPEKVIRELAGSASRDSDRAHGLRMNLGREGAAMTDDCGSRPPRASGRSSTISRGNFLRPRRD